jgi:hypothetical protein
MKGARRAKSRTPRPINPRPGGTSVARSVPVLSPEGAKCRSVARLARQGSRPLLRESGGEGQGERRLRARSAQSMDLWRFARGPPLLRVAPSPRGRGGWTFGNPKGSRRAPADMEGAGPRGCAPFGLSLSRKGRLYSEEGAGDLHQSENCRIARRRRESTVMNTSVRAHTRVVGESALTSPPLHQGNRATPALVFTSVDPARGPA